MMIPLLTLTWLAITIHCLLPSAHSSKVNQVKRAMGSYKGSQVFLGKRFKEDRAQSTSSTN